MNAIGPDWRARFDLVRTTKKAGLSVKTKNL
jgi:hypothetical protein